MSASPVNDFLSRLLPQPGDRTATVAGIGLMLLGVLMFSAGDAVGKHIVATYTVAQLMLIRALFSLAVLAPAIWQQRAKFLGIQRPGLQIVRVALSTFEIAAFFAATVYLPLADVITCYLASPIFVTALSAIFLGEHVGWRRWSAILIGFIGVMVALQPSAQTLSWPSLIALAGSLAFAVMMIATRSLRGTPDIVLMTTQLLGSLAFGLCVALPSWQTPPLADLGLFALAGIISIVASFSVTRSLKLAPASVVTPYQYSMILWAVLFGYVVFGDVPTFGVMAGGAIIVAAGLYIFLRERELNREPVVATPPG